MPIDDETSFMFHLWSFAHPCRAQWARVRATAVREKLPKLREGPAVGSAAI